MGSGFSICSDNAATGPSPSTSPEQISQQTNPLSNQVDINSGSDGAQLPPSSENMPKPRNTFTVTYASAGSGNQRRGLETRNPAV